MRKPFTRAELIDELTRFLAHGVDSSPEDGARPPSSDGDELTRSQARASFSRLPDELVHSLRQATEAADIYGFLELIEVVARHDQALAALLAAHAEQYDYDALSSLMLEPEGGPIWS